MADGKFLVGKPAGGVTTVTMTDGASNTNLVLPESGTVATEAYADGKTTLTQVKAEISTGSNLVTSPTGAIGYGNGAGGIVTQLTSKSTNVTLNKPCGFINTHNETLAAGATIAFIFSNSLLTVYDNLIVTGIWGASPNYEIKVAGVADNISKIAIKNITAGSLSESIIFNFIVIKGAVL